MKYQGTHMGERHVFDLFDLDQESRDFAIAELEVDVAAGTVYESPRLSEYGRSCFPGDLRAALAEGTPETLEHLLQSGGKFNLTEMSQRNGVPYEKRVPNNAASLLAGGAYVHYYLRAVCLRAIQRGDAKVTVYRARESGFHRPESDNQIGRVLDAAILLDNLRRYSAEPLRIELPDVGSGLAVHL